MTPRDGRWASTETADGPTGGGSTTRDCMFPCRRLRPVRDNGHTRRWGPQGVACVSDPNPCPVLPSSPEARRRRQQDT